MIVAIVGAVEAERAIDALEAALGDWDNPNQNIDFALPDVPQPKTLTFESMQRIAKELNLSETTFVMPAQDDANDFHVRIFTPVRELPMAGQGVRARVDAGEGVDATVREADSVGFRGVVGIDEGADERGGVAVSDGESGITGWGSTRYRNDMECTIAPA